MAYEAEDLSKGFRELPPGRMYRRILERHRETPLKFLTTPSRFSDTEAGTAAAKFANLYMAEAVGTTVWETIIRTRLVGSGVDHIDQAWLVDSLILEIEWVAPLVVLDLTRDQHLRLNLHPGVIKDASHAEGQRLSRAVHEGYTDCDGIYYSSYFTNRACLMLYDRAEAKLDPTPTLQPLMTMPLVADRLTLSGLPKEALL